MTAIILSRDEVRELTGYRARTRQVAWLREHLRIVPPLRPDGSPVVSRAQVEAALSGTRSAESATGIRWSR